MNFSATKNKNMFFAFLPAQYNYGIKILTMRPLAKPNMRLNKKSASGSRAEAGWRLRQIDTALRGDMRITYLMLRIFVDRL